MNRIRLSALAAALAIPTVHAQFGMESMMNPMTMMNPAMMMAPVNMGMGMMNPATMMNPAMMMAPMSMGMGMMNPATMMAPMGGMAPAPSMSHPMTGMGAHPSMMPSMPPPQQAGFIPAIPMPASPPVTTAPQQAAPAFNFFDTAAWMQMFPNSMPPGAVQPTPAAK